MTLRELKLILSQMKNDNKKIFASNFLIPSILLVWVYFGLIYPSTHLHHDHNASLLAANTNSQSTTEANDHNSAGHHHDDLPDHNEHEHTYDKHIDWQIIRSRDSKTITLDDHYLLVVNRFVTSDDGKSLYLDYDKVSFIDEPPAYYLTLRGPPQTV